MAVQRRTGPSGSARGIVGRPSPLSIGIGPVELSVGGGGGPPLPPGVTDDQLTLGGQVAPSAVDLIRSGGIAACRQFFSESTCNSVAGIVEGVLGGGGGGSEPETGDPAIPGFDAGSGTGTCPAGTVRIPFLGCVNAPGGETTGGGMVISGGEAVNGRYGAAIAPQQRQRTRLRCPRGMVLGKDNLCYDHLPNRDRKWPKARRPLLTGGDLNAITRASQAANRMKKQQRRLQKLGLLKKPSSRRRAQKPPQVVVRQTVED